MKIVKEWTTVELIEFMNSYKHVSEEDKIKYNDLMKAVHNELSKRQPMIGMTYKL